MVVNLGILDSKKENENLIQWEFMLHILQIQSMDRFSQPVVQATQQAVYATQQAVHE